MEAWKLWKGFFMRLYPLRERKKETSDEICCQLVALAAVVRDVSECVRRKMCENLQPFPSRVVVNMRIPMKNEEEFCIKSHALSQQLEICPSKLFAAKCKPVNTFCDIIVKTTIRFHKGCPWLWTLISVCGRRIAFLPPSLSQPPSPSLWPCCKDGWQTEFGVERDKIPLDRMGALIYFADKDCG